MSRGGASDVLILLFSATVKCSERSMTMDWLCCNSELFFECETKQSLAVRYLNFSVKVYSWKDSTGIHINIVFWGSEGIHISIVLLNHKNLEQSVFSFHLPLTLASKPCTTEALQNRHERIVIYLLFLSLQCGRTSFLFPFPVVKVALKIVRQAFSSGKCFRI